MTRRTPARLLPLLLAATLAAAGGLPVPVVAGRPPAARPITVSTAVHHDRSLPLRELARSSTGTPVQPRHQVVPLRSVPVPAATTGETKGPTKAAARQSALVPSVATTISSWDGLGSGFVGPSGTMTVDSVPPDTNGDASPTAYVEIVNTQLAVFDKSTGSATFGPVPISTLWSGFGGLCQTNDDGDPTVKWDRLAGRWIVTQFAVTGANGTTVPYLECVAVSQTGDPAGAYLRYSFGYANFPDYPKLAVWPDAYYASFNLFSTNFLGGLVCAYDRAAMLSGAAATQQCASTGASSAAPLPSDLDGWWLPPAGSPDYLLSLSLTTPDSLVAWRFHVDWANPAASSLTGPTQIGVASFDFPCGGTAGTCVPQSGTSTKLDTLGDRLMYRLAYRRYADGHESLVVTHSVASGSSVAPRWYELRISNGWPAIYQQGTYAPDSTFRWMGSMAADGAGNLALGYSASDSTIVPGIRYTGRVPTDQAGQLESEASIIAGTGAQTGGITRWGDYTSLAVDPSDDCTFWYANEYLTANGSFNWHTRIASFRFPGCSGSPSVPSAPTAVVASVRPDPASVAASMRVTWSPPDYAGGAITGYVVTPYVNGVTPVPSVHIGSEWQTSALVTGLVPGTPYTFRVAATNAVGTGTPSAASAPVSAPAASPKASTTPLVATRLPWLPINELQSGLGSGSAAMSGSTSMTMVLRYFYPAVAVYTVPWVDSQLGATATDIAIDAVAAGLETLSATAWSGGPPLTATVPPPLTSSTWMSAVEAQIDVGRPLIALLPTTAGLPGPASTSHYVVLVGYTATIVSYADPALGQVVTVPLATFDAAWGAQGLADPPYGYVTIAKS